jgi:anti-sigma regulatory factor (Ser/Thr protein kinase)
VDEIATNIIVHGYDEAGIDGDVTLTATMNDQTLTIAIEDEARPFDPRQRVAPDDLDRPLEDRQIGGLGVYLAMNGVDEFQYEYIGNRNRNIFVMYRPIHV